MGIKFWNIDISKIKIASGFTPRLPSAYQEVEWIWNSWTQYIDTGVAIPNHKAIANIEYTAFNGWMYLGAYMWPDSWVPWGHLRLYWGRAGSTGQFCYGLLSSYSESGGSISLNTKYELEVSMVSWNLYFKHDGTTYGTSSATYTTSKAWNYWILAQNNEQAREIWNSAKVYDYKVYDSSDTLLRDFVPCYRIADWEIWMYDLVNDTFYTNAGSWTFTKWNDVYPELYKDIKKVYKWSTQVRPTLSPREPWVNTVAYYPLTSATTVNNQVSGGTNLTNSNVTFWTAHWVNCATISGNDTTTWHTADKYLYANITWLPTWANARTFSYWVYNDNASNTGMAETYVFQWQASTNRMILSASSNENIGYYWISQYGASGAFWAILRQQRCHHCIVYDGSKFTWYVNWVSTWTWTRTINTWNTYFCIWWSWLNPAWNAFNGSFSNVIIENVAWTSQDVADYYNLTKSNYWL
jgi:hypothetical protein